MPAGAGAGAGLGVGNSGQRGAGHTTAAAKEAAPLLTGGSSRCRHCRVPGPAGHSLASPGLTGQPLLAAYSSPPSPDYRAAERLLGTEGSTARGTRPEYGAGTLAGRQPGQAATQAETRALNTGGSHAGRATATGLRSLLRKEGQGGASRDSPSARGLRGDRPPVAAQSPSFPPGKFKLSTLQCFQWGPKREAHSLARSHPQTHTQAGTHTQTHTHTDRDKQNFPEERASSVQPLSGETSLPTSRRAEPQTCPPRTHAGRRDSTCRGASRVAKGQMP